MRFAVRPVLALLAAVLAVLVAAPAAAHEAPDETQEPFFAVITGVSAEVPGYELIPRGSIATLEVHVEPGHVVEILGYQGEPYARVDETGAAFVNLNSPTYWSNESSADDAPDSAGVDAEPNWEWVSGGGGFEWHDHRIHWMRAEAPEVGPDRVAQSWSVDLVVDGTPVTVSGDLIYNPEIPFEDYKARMGGGHGGDDHGHDHGTGTDADDGGSAFPVAAAAAVAALLVAVGVAAVVVRNQGRPSGDKQ